MKDVWWIVLLFLLCGGGVGNFIRGELEQRRQRARDRERLQVSGPDPVCGCGHHYSFHNGQTGLCMHKGRAETKWDEYGDPVKWEMVQCGCQRYIGPQPLDVLYAPEITSSYVTEKTKDVK